MTPTKSNAQAAHLGKAENSGNATSTVEIVAKTPVRATSYDRITILRHPTNVLAKTWKADGRIDAYGGGKYFIRSEAELNSVRDLADLLANLNGDRKACVIRGVYLGDDEAVKLDPEYQPGRVRRIADIYEDSPHHWMLVEIDEFEPICYDPVLEPENAINEYIQSNLPPCFAGASYYWQLSNSAGHAKNVGKLKAHVWFWLDTPYTSEQLKAWATQFNVPLDKSVFNVVQVHYTAAPIFDNGVSDPVAVRYGFAAGLAGDSVALDIDATILSVATTKRATRHQKMLQIVDSDPVAVKLNDLGMIKSIGKKGELYIECPRKEHHTGESSETSTTYYPAHTGGYAHGAFVCLHDHCRDVPQREFLNALGIDTVQDLFEGMAVTAEEDRDPLLPSFQRDKNGSIEASKANIVRALQAPHVAGYFVRFDEFEGDIVLAPSDDDQAWRHLTDTHYTEIRLNLEAVRFREIGKDSIRDCIDFVAEQARFDTAKAWLGTLTWDGVPRVERFLADYLGTENTAYHRAVSRYIWTALAGRVLAPGVKADMAPVLVGAQGVRKSTAVAAMAPSPNFFLELDLGKKDDDISRLLRGKLVIELGELRGMRAKEMEHLKSFLARQHEKFIEKFKVRETCYPRRGLFIGTTNRDDFLTDDTGNRRWLPFRVGRCDPDGIAAVRDQLWAEGAAMFQAKGVDIDAERLAASELAEFTEQDSWDVLIERWLDEPASLDGGKPRDRQHLTSADILRECLGFANRDITRAGEMRVAVAMRRLGYQQKTRTVGDTGGRSRHRVWIVG